MVRIKLPERFTIPTYSGKPFNIHEPTDWNLDDLIQEIKEENAAFLSSLQFQVSDDVIKGLVLEDILKQVEKAKTKENLKEFMKQKIKIMEAARQKK